MAEPVHLHGRGAQREDRGARVGGVAGEVDEHVDPVGVDAPGDRLGRLARHVAEDVDAGADRREIASSTFTSE